jgi:hypothetical protein
MTDQASTKPLSYQGDGTVLKAGMPVAEVWYNFTVRKLIRRTANVEMPAGQISHGSLLYISGSRDAVSGDKLMLVLHGHNDTKAPIKITAASNEGWEADFGTVG